MKSQIQQLIEDLNAKIDHLDKGDHGIMTRLQAGKVIGMRDAFDYARERLKEMLDPNGFNGPTNLEAILKVKAACGNCKEPGCQSIAQPGLDGYCTLHRYLHSL